MSNYYTTDIQVLACSVPARFYVKMTSLDTTLYSGILTESINVDLQTYGQLQILIVDYGDEISIEVWKSGTQYILKLGRLWILDAHTLVVDYKYSYVL